MKVGIYLPGLGESTQNVSLLNYVNWFTNAMDHNNDNPKVKYRFKTEKINYGKDDSSLSNKISIIETKDGKEQASYVFYDFRYSEILTKNFKESSILYKSVQLLGIVALKFFPLIAHVFKKSKFGYSLKFRMQSLMAIFVFLLISFFGILLLPGALNFTADAVHLDILKVSINNVCLNTFFHYFANFAKAATAFSAVLFSVVPKSKDIFGSMAIEFVSAHYYLETGERKQEINGHLQMLLEYIAENEGPELQVDLHGYSFGSVVAIDFLFPFGSSTVVRTRQCVSSLITIGCPHDFFSTYYAGYFDKRSTVLTHIKWYNVYCEMDALGSNFRYDNTDTKAQYSFIDGFLPENIQYEINPTKRGTIVGIIVFSYIRAHRLYWDSSYNSDSCLGLVYQKMKQDGKI